MADSSQGRVGRVRPPRVQITYDVEDGDGTAQRELPMIVGVVSNLSGDGEDSTEYKDREFVQVDPGGLDGLMNRLNPKVQFDVADKVSGEEDQEVRVDLNFRSMDDFSPMGVASQLPQTAKLLESRQKLADLYSKLEANDKLEGILGDVLANEEKLAELKQQLGGLDDDAEGGDDSNG
ncbi:MAG: type VI secretion system contractile sheath small subunit [Gammaproteobacteria bacterium]|nr:type VI secretion system contractile sheath small subunit [Gammaproteobacteria bacterium]MYB38109.1 type VI secretion system contractile sheath small subunit [Gammaproteobacteria bacterium]